MPRLLFALAALLLVAAPSRAAVTYSGLRNITLPFDSNGVYINLLTGSSTTSDPGTYDTAPWLFASFGGSGLGTGPLLRLVVTGSVVAGGEQAAKLAPGTTVGTSSRFSIGDSGYNGSESHVGPAISQFQLGTQGYIGYEFEPTVGGPTYFGWMRLTIDNTIAGGLVTDWAYESTPGVFIVVPEPSRALLLLGGLLAVTLRRHRRK